MVVLGIETRPSKARWFVFCAIMPARMNAIEGVVVYVIGSNHGIQRQEPNIWDTPQAREQSAHFRELVSSIVQEKKIQFVGEEWGLPTMTVAHAVADDNGKIPWANINTTNEELVAMKIPRGYANGNYPTAQKEQWHRQREDVFIRELLEQKGDAEKLIVICGFEHFQRLTEFLRKTCKSVEPVDYRTMSWYDKDAFTD
jgi:hypothetical protein